jgi:hypothetical protein
LARPRIGLSLSTRHYVGVEPRTCTITSDTIALGLAAFVVAPVVASATAVTTTGATYV